MNHRQTHVMYRHCDAAEQHNTKVRADIDILTEKEHIAGMIKMSWIGIAAFLIFLAVVGVLEWLAW